MEPARPLPSTLEATVTQYGKNQLTIKGADFLIKRILGPLLAALKSEAKKSTQNLDQLNEAIDCTNQSIRALYAMAYKAKKENENLKKLIPQAEFLDEIEEKGNGVVELAQQLMPILGRIFVQTIKPERPSQTNTKSSQNNTKSNQTNTGSKRGANNPNTKKALDLGNKVHYDQLNGGPPGSKELPSALQARYPNTQFNFTSRGAKGADVEVVGGTHPSQYPGSTWQTGNNFGDFKPGNASGQKKFNSEVKSGKLPENSQLLKYDPKTGALQ